MIDAVADVIAEAVFASTLQPSRPVTPAEAWTAVADSVARHGVRGCVELVAQAYGDHPETAAPRMRFARELATALTATLALSV